MSNRVSASNASSSVFNELRLSGELCDAVLNVEDGEFQVHKVILCKCSPYFRALFSRWNTPDKKVFNIPGLSSDMMQLIIEFAYTDCVSVTEENAQELLIAADQLNVMDVVKACADFLGEKLCPENCIGIWQFTDVILCEELQRKAYCYITEHFEDIVSCEEFKVLSVNQLTNILDSDSLNVKSESVVFEAVLYWIAHAPQERKEQFPALFSKVRLAMMTGPYIRTTVMLNELVRSSPDWLHMASEACDIMELKSPNRPFGFCNLLARPRVPGEVLLAIGGWSGGDPTNAIEAYDVRSNRWISMMTPDERPRAYHGSVCLGGYVYCIGGFDRVEYYNSVRRFDLNTKMWEEVAPMHGRRCYVSVTVLNGNIYALGGFDGHVRVNTAEQYTPETNQWTCIAPMHEQRSDASCTTLDNKVYICGGFNGSDCLETCEYYTPQTNQWTTITPMHSQRSGIGVIAYAGRVFAVGGFDGSNRLRSAEAYNPGTNTWHEMPSMMTTRSNFGIEVIDDLLFVVGGFNGRTTSECVEFFDATTNEWSEASDMEIFRSALSCCVVSGLSNMDEFVVPRDSLPLVYLVDDLPMEDLEDANSDTEHSPALS